MLVNLSNHPTKLWSPDQLSLALELFGAVEDVEFPVINPNWSITVVAKLAQKYADQIHDTYGNRAGLSIHIMGEMTFVYQFVYRMRGKGINCIASSSQRVVEFDGDTKKSVFRFVNFRNYF